MNYQLAYERFCQKMKAENRKNGITSLGQYNRRRSNSQQVHHIIPKVLGGKNSAENYVLLDDDSHKYAHVLLNLALIQKGKIDVLRRIGYYDCPNINFLMKKNAIKSCKMAVYVEGKKHEPIVMSILQAAKHFCFVARKNFMNKDSLECIERQVFMMAISGTPKYGFRVKIAVS